MYYDDETYSHLQVSELGGGQLELLHMGDIDETTQLYR